MHLMVTGMADFHHFAYHVIMRNSAILVGVLVWYVNSLVTYEILRSLFPNCFLDI